MPIFDPRHRPASRALGLLSAMACTGGLLLGPSTAGAFLTTTPVQTIEFCLNCTGSTVSSDEGTNPQTFTASNTFGRFDAGLGTLQSVRFTWVTGIQGDLWSEGDFDVPTAGLTIETAIALSGLPGSPILSTSAAQAANVSNGALTASINWNVSDSRTYSTPADLSHFIGNGTFGVDMSMVLGVESANATVIGRGWWASPLGTDAPARLSVEYTYDAPTTPHRTPEPGTIALGALAAALGIAHQRRSRRSA